MKNAQGDVIGITNNAGDIVVKYEYDAWGALLSTTGSLAGTVGVKNPLRYRGYYYDTESGLYYLNSRYYDPVVGRFVNADGLLMMDCLETTFLHIAKTIRLRIYSDENFNIFKWRTI